MKLEFSNLSIEEVIASIDENKATEWQLDIRNFLQQYAENDTKVLLHELQGEVIYDVDLEVENIKNTAIALNQYLGLKRGDTTILNESVRVKSGVIVLAQAIEAKMDIYCSEVSDVIKIPYTGQDNNTINWGLSYVYLDEEQIFKSQDVLHRIEKIAVESYGMKDKTKAHLSLHDKQQLYEVFSVKSYPVAVRKIGEDFYKTIGDIKISRSKYGHLVLDSPIFPTPIDTQKVVQLEDDRTFRWLLKSEILNDDSEQILDFDHIERVLAPHIPTSFSVLLLPDFDTGEEVVTLIIQRLYIDDFNFPTDGLKDYEIPRQNYTIGDFPQTEDRVTLREEAIRLLTDE